MSHEMCMWYLNGYLLPISSSLFWFFKSSFWPTWSNLVHDDIDCWNHLMKSRCCFYTIERRIFSAALWWNTSLVEIALNTDRTKCFYIKRLGAVDYRQFRSKFCLIMIANLDSPFHSSKNGEYFVKCLSQLYVYIGFVQ